MSRLSRILCVVSLAASLAPAPLSAQAAWSPQPKDLDIFSWRHIGPWNFSGRITNFAVPRGQSKTYYVLTATGGLWKTEDAGVHFAPLFEKFGNMSMGYLAVAPSDPKVLYLGTGESLHARAAYHGNGMWKSADAGKTWTRAGLEQSFAIPKIEVDPKNPDVVYAAAEGRLYDNGMDCERGLYKTTDGGKTWARVLGPEDRGIVDFVMDPANPDIVIAASYRMFRRAWTFIDRQPGNLLYKTADGGKTWRKLAKGLPDLAAVETGRNGLALYEKNTKIVYVRMDEEVNLGLSERDNASQFREGAIFNDDYYLAKFKSYKINPELMRLVKFAPLAADSERALAEKLNGHVRDGRFAANLGVDLAAFNKAARRAYAGNKDVLSGIDEIEKILKKEAEKPGLARKINGLIVLAFFAESPGIVFGEGFKVTDPGKLVLHKDFAGLLTYDAKEVKDAQDLSARLADLAAYPDFTLKLKIDSRRVMSEALKAYKDKKDIVAKFAGSEELAAEYEEVKGRYQAVNRYILQTLYGDAFAVREPVKKAGVIYRSDDQGESWARMTEYKMTGGSDIVNQVEAGYNGRLVVDPNDDKVLIAHETRTSVSRDSGKTFRFPGWENRGVHVDSRAVWIDPLDSKHILNANDGGVSESWDGGEHWAQRETISAQQFYDVSVDDAVPYNVMGGTQDNGCWIGPSMNRNPNGVFPADWLYLPSGDGFYVVRDWWNPEYIYFESQFGGSNRMNLRTGETIGLARRNTPEETAAGAAAQRYQWNAPIVLSPHNPGIVFVCSQYVHRSPSRGDRGSWQTVSPDLTRADRERQELSKKTNLQYATVFTFAESPLKPGLYWAGTDDGNLQVSPDGGHTWTNITARFYDMKTGRLKPGAKGAVIPFDRWVKRVVPSAHDADTCYVVYSGYRSHSEEKTYVYVTRDLGLTFEDIGRGMDNPASDLEEDPGNPDVLFLATDHGLYLTIDRGRTWTNFSSVAPHVIIKDLTIHRRDRDLVIATYGRGIYIADIFPFKEFRDEVFKKDAHLFEIEDVVQWARFDRRGTDLGEIAKAANPPAGATFYFYLKDKADKVTLTVKDPDGGFVQEVIGRTDKGVQKAAWNLSKRVEQGRLQGLSSEERARLTRLVPGTYNVTLTVDGKDVGTKKVVVRADVIDRAII